MKIFVRKNCEIDNRNRILYYNVYMIEIKRVSPLTGKEPTRC